MINIESIKAGDKIKWIASNQSCHFAGRPKLVFNHPCPADGLCYISDNRLFHVRNLIRSYWQKVEEPPVKHYSPIHDFGPIHPFWHVKLEQDDGYCMWYEKASITKPSAPTTGWGPPGKLIPDTIFNDGVGQLNAKHEAEISSLKRELAMWKRQAYQGHYNARRFEKWFHLAVHEINKLQDILYGKDRCSVCFKGNCSGNCCQGS